MVLKNIIFSGGGFKGWAYIGTIKALNEEINFKEIHEVIGVSVGAIFGLFYVLNLDYKTILNYFLNLDLSKYLDIDLDSILSNQSILHGTHYKNIILTLMKLNKNVSDNLTFIQLYDLTGIKFTTCALNINTIELVYFNHLLTPHVKVIDSIMATSALPILFPAYKIGEDFYYDGGICNNCPCNLVDPETSIAFTVGSIYIPSKWNILNLINSLTRMLNKLIIKNQEIIFNIISKKYDNEMYNINQSNDTIFNIYMDGYTHTKNVLKAISKGDCDLTVFNTFS